MTASLRLETAFCVCAACICIMVCYIHSVCTPGSLRSIYSFCQDQIPNYIYSLRDAAIVVTYDMS